jgi:phosphoglycerate-specific signal transduction histidine kinase
MSPLEEVKSYLRADLRACEVEDAEHWLNMLAAIESLEAQVAKLREALEPFARVAEVCKSPNSTGLYCVNNAALNRLMSSTGNNECDPEFTVGDLRRAAQVLAEGGGK